MRTLQRARETDPELLEEFQRSLTIYAPAYEDGHLLEAGGLNDQPARYVELVQLIRASNAAIDEKAASLIRETKTEE